MASNDDLERFRKQWVEEVAKSKSSSKLSSTGKSDSDGNEIIQEDAVDDAKSSAIVPNVTHFSGNLLLDDEDSQEPTSSTNFMGVSKETLETDDAYYPFKIVTQFLNEAPRKISTKRKKAIDEKQPKMSYSKKKYFQNLLQSSFNEKKVNPDTKKNHSEESKVSNDDKRMLDIFIADLDEVNEIPFFESTLAREVAFKIFQYLDMATLCVCAQVSSSWKSLADDELLWCRISHKLGYDTHSKVFEGEGWKETVQHHLRQKTILEANWKARVGKPYQLSFPRGGVLCGVASNDSTIVAGYTNCQVNSWNTLTGEECTLNASNTSLVIDETSEDLGCIRNEIRHLSTTANVTAASFKHGFVDLWRNNQGVDPIHTMVFNSPDVSSLCIHDVDRNCSLVAASQQTRLQVSRVDHSAGTKLADIDMKTPVSKTAWMASGQDTTPRLIISCSSSVWLKGFDPTSSVCEGVISQDAVSMVEVQNLIYAPVTCLGVRQGQEEVGIGFTMITGASSQVKLNVYDLNSRPPKASLSGHTWFISCMDLPTRLPHQLITGSADRKVRLYDLRAGSTPLMTMIGHSAKVNCVQMDDFKVVSGDEAGFVFVWDARSGRKLWDIHNRHPVQYCRFDGRLLIIGNVPYDKFPEKGGDEFECVSSLRYRGTVQLYNFLADQQTHGVPDICLSSYNEPEASNYNLALATPYDAL